MTRNQKIILALGAVAVIAAILIFTGVLPGLRKSALGPAKLVIWGTVDRNSAFYGAIAAYQKERGNIQIDYREFPEETYEGELVNALAAGRGPDLLMFRNSWLPKHFDKIKPFSKDLISLPKFQDIFPLVAEQDFTSVGTVYALPLYIDTLALLYNKDIFDNKGIAIPPKNWSEVESDILKIRELKKGGGVKLAGAALGGSAKNIHAAGDVLSLLFLQTGVPINKKNSYEISIADTGVQTLNFYTGFSNPKNKYYTWGANLKNSIDLFAEGSVGMIFDYSGSLRAIREKNPFARIGVSEMPQPLTSKSRIDYPNYYGVAVSTSSQFPEYAADLALFLTTRPDISKIYLAASKHPPALRSLVNAYADDPELGVFAKQTLTARSWPQIDNRAVQKAFSDMIDEVVGASLDPFKAMKKAEEEVNRLVR